MAKAALTHTRVNLVSALMQHKEGERAQATAGDTPNKIPQQLQNNPGKDWIERANDTARALGEVVGETTVQCFNWARNALKTTAHH